MKLSELTHKQLFENEKIGYYRFDCDASDVVRQIKRNDGDCNFQEEYFNKHKNRIISKYGDVDVVISLPEDENLRRITGDIIILDDNYSADKQAYIKAKGEALAKWGYTD